MESLYPSALKAFLELAVEGELVSKFCWNTTIDRMAGALDTDRDSQFTYLGLQTLYDRYFIRKDDVQNGLPQVFFMRIAMGLALREENREERAIEFYQLLSSFDYMASTPTLFNSRNTEKSALKLLPHNDLNNLDGIYWANPGQCDALKMGGGGNMSFGLSPITRFRHQGNLLNGKSKRCCAVRAESGQRHGGRSESRR